MARLSDGTGVVGVGIDLVDPERLRAALRRRPGLALRLFSAAERQGIDTGRLAAADAFAVKECVMKALGQGLGRISFTDIEVTAEPGEAATGEVAMSVRLGGRAATRAAEVGAGAWDVVVGRSHHHVVATAVATRAGPSTILVG